MGSNDSASGPSSLICSLSCCDAEDFIVLHTAVQAYPALHLFIAFSFKNPIWASVSDHLLLFDHDATSLLTASLPNIGVDFTQIWYFVCRFN